MLRSCIELELLLVQSFGVALTAADSDAQLEALGELMFQVYIPLPWSVLGTYMMPQISKEAYLCINLDCHNFGLKCHTLILHGLLKI